MGLDTFNARTALLIGVAAIYAAMFLFMDGLRFEPRLDEEHFWKTTEEHFVGSFPPSLDSLRSYPEIITPLSYIIWGQLDRLTSEGIFAGRILNLLFSVSMVTLLAYSRRPSSLAGPLAAVGLLLYPYFIALSTHLYTDTIAAFFALFALHAHARGWLLSSIVLFALAISTRQYLIQIPAAIVLWEAWRIFQGEPRRRELASAIAASATLLGWIFFWGGLAPQAGMAAWIPQYPSPMFDVFWFKLEYGNYFLVCVGIYFVIPEMLLFRRWPSPQLFRSRSFMLCVLGTACLFLLAPPFLSTGFPGGAFGRFTRWMLPGAVGDIARIVLYYSLALLTALRFFRKIDLGFWIVSIACIMAMKSQIPWEKYIFPTLTALWYLRSRPGLLLADLQVPEARTRVFIPKTQRPVKT
jgi:hypothetical protein